MPWFFIGDNISTIPPQKQKKMENLLETKSRSDIIEYGGFSDFGVHMVNNKTGGWVCVFNHRQTLTDHAQSASLAMTIMLSAGYCHDNTKTR